PSALHPPPSTLHPPPSTLHPAPCTLHPPPQPPRSDTWLRSCAWVLGLGLRGFRGSETCKSAAGNYARPEWRQSQNSISTNSLEILSTFGGILRIRGMPSWGPGSTRGC
ncbi:hypothetical protein T484DRAFT_1633077, partial [Baffinella frigidus]